MSATKTFKIGLSATDKQNMAQDVYERVLALTFAEYDSGETYNTGDFVVYSDTLYQCLADNVTGAWDSTKWQQATLQDLLDDVESAVASVNGKADILSLENGTLVVAKAQTAKQIENINDEVGSTQTSPFNFQATGTDNNTTETPTAPIAKQLELRGNSVAFNQLFATNSIATQTKNGITCTNNGDGSFTLSGTASADTRFIATGIAKENLSGHKIYWGFKNLTSAISGVVLEEANSGISISTTAIITIGNLAYNFAPAIKIASGTDLTTPIKVIPQITDITQLGKEYSSVVEFNRDYPLPYYEYNAGTLISCKANKLITIGCNQFDGQTEKGGIGTGAGANYDSNYIVRSKNYIKVIAGQKYLLEVPSIQTYGCTYTYFFYDYDKNYIGYSQNYGFSANIANIPNNAHYARFTLQWSEFDQQTMPNIMFRLSWNESHDYVDYEKHEYDLPNIELRSAGDVYDSITPNGTLTRRVGTYTFTGNETSQFAYDADSGRAWFNGLDNVLKAPASGADLGNAKSSLYIVAKQNDYEDISLMIYASGTNKVVFRDTRYNTLANFLAHIAGSKLYYELITPTTEQVSEFPENVVVDDFGTMEFVSSLTAPIVPQGNKFFYPADYVLFLDDMYNRSKDGGDVADATNFVIKSELTPYATQDTILQNAIGGTLRQCLCVKENIDFDDTDMLDMGYISWYMTTAGGLTIFYTNQNAVRTGNNYPLICTKYAYKEDAETRTNKQIRNDSYLGANLVYVIDDAYTDATAFKNAMKGVLLAYEKA